MQLHMFLPVCGEIRKDVAGVVKGRYGGSNSNQGLLAGLVGSEALGVIRLPPQKGLGNPDNSNIKVCSE